MGGENLGRTTIRYVTLAKKMEMAHNGMETVHGNGPQRDGNGSFRSQILYMASAHGTMSIRVETNHARVKIDETCGL